MSSDLKPEMLKTTQTLLSKFIKKPPLTDKLLRKPPFRYLHDIVTSIIKETGFLKGLYTPEEMIVDNNLDKAGKIAFLDKLISAVKVATGVSLTVKSSKIVSGLEVAKTHELLQAIGHALENKVDSKNAVEEVLRRGVRKSAKDSNRSKNKEDGSKRKSIDENIPKQEEAEKSDSLSPRSVKNSLESKQDPSPASSAKENVQNNQQINGNKEADPRDSTTEEGENDAPQEGDPNGSGQGENPTASTENTHADQEPVHSGQMNGPRTRAEKSPRERPENRKSSSPRNDRKSSSPRNDKKSSSPRDEKSSSPRDSKKSTSRDQKSSKGDEPTTREEKKTPPDKNKPGRERAAKTLGEPKKPDQNTNNDGALKASGKSPKHEKSPSVKDKREETLSSGVDRTERESPGKQKADRAERDKTAAKKDSRPTSARPGSRKPLKASHAGATNTPAAGDTKPPSAVKRPASAMKRPASAGPRPPSARPGAPRVKERGEVGGEEESGAVRAVNLIRETGREDEEEMVTVETAEIENQRKQSLSTREDQENQGQLVSQILETQKDFEDGIEPEVLRRTQIEWEGARKRGREAMTRDIQKLKDCVQVITRCTHPLGKLMEFYQEDVEEIERELCRWKARSEELRKQLILEKEKTIASVQPLQLQLQELESKIDKESEQVSMNKMRVLKNDQRIQKLLSFSRGN